MADVILTQEGDTVSVTMPGQYADIEAAHKSPNCTVIDSKQLPADREFRDAWTLDGTINLGKAKEIWREKLRAKRNVRLKELDVEWMRAMESGNIKKASAIANKKQTLRDIPDREEITKATSIKELKAFWPEELEG